MRREEKKKKEKRERKKKKKKKPASNLLTVNVLGGSLSERVYLFLITLSNS